MRASLVLALVAVACPALGVTAAAADVVFGAHDTPLELGPATIETEVTRFEARYTVRYEVRNPGPLPDEAMVELAVPPASAVTGLRYQPRAGAAWLDARLLPADDAFVRWERHADAPFAAQRGPALVEHLGSISALRLGFVPARDRVAVEYTVIAPVCRAAGHWVTPSVAGARRSMSAADAAKVLGDEVRVACGATDPPQAWDGDHFVVVAATAISASRGVESRMVMVPAGTQRIVEVVIDTGARLSPAPRNASVVFVIDASISMGQGGVAAQLAMVRAYLARAPDARFELVVYRRHATRVFGRWRAGADVDRALAEAGEAPFALANGSS
ncbi:MAG: VWA domain-containing protein, partial [Deltaproteobacteria bacterium]|nr:VWA domain-containing protein [Kofleriaceae bacterium]